MVSINGLSAFPITPADAEGGIVEGGFRNLIERVLAAKVDSIGVLGSTGAYMYFDLEQRRRGLEIAIDQVRDRAQVIVGVGALTTKDAVTIAKHAKRLGATAGLLAPVSYAPLSDEEVFEHFAAVVGESGLPIVIYDNTSTTHFAFSKDLLDRIAEMPGVVGIKNGAGATDEARSNLSDQRQRFPAGFSIGYSGDKRSVEPMIAGADVWYSVLAGVLPNICMLITRAASRGDALEARRLRDELSGIWGLFKQHSSMRTAYALVDYLGLEAGQLPRPLLPLPKHHFESLRDELASVFELEQASA